MTASYQAVTDDLGKLDEDALARPSGCHGWSGADLLFHLLLDAQRAFITFATQGHLLPAGDFRPRLGEPVPVGWADVSMR